MRRSSISLSTVLVIVALLASCVLIGPRVMRAFSPSAPARIAASNWPGSGPTAAAPRPTRQPTVTPRPQATAAPQAAGAPPMATQPIYVIIPSAVPLTGLALPNAAPAANAALSQALDTYVSNLTSAQAFQGAVLVARDGQTLLSKGYGMANAAQGTPNTAQTRFRLASMTKQFTSMAIMQLEAAGKLNVQDPICNYLDPCPNTWKPITIRNLLSHTSGIPSYTDFMDYEPTQMQPATPDQLVARFRDQPLLFEPGTMYSYGNSGYVLLGVIIEKVSGESYENYLREHIFGPLEMSNSGVDHNVSGNDQSVGYTTFNDPAPPIDTTTLFACGSLYSTVEDLYRWDQALYTNKLLPAPLITEMFTPVLSDYAYGWKLGATGTHRRIAHPGNIDGVATFIARYPDDHLTVIVLSNMAAANVVGMGDQLANMVFNTP